MTYDRIVAAALAETTSKFRLAEALAMDIPPKRRGPTADDEQGVYAYLEEARQAIIDAGGEPKALLTLKDYRLTALWVSRFNPTNFQWVPGVSFTAHDAGRKRMSYAEFVALPKKTSDLIKGTSHGSKPETTVRNWSPEQKGDAARELMKDPAVADKVAADPIAASHAAAAIDRHTEQQRQQRDERRREPDDWPVNPLNLVWEFRQLHKTIDRIAAEVSKRGAIVGPEEREALTEEVAWLRNALEMIEHGIKGHSLDLALARILAGES